MHQNQGLEHRYALLEEQVRQLRIEIDRTDDWANGLFVVLSDVLPLLLKDRPEIAAKIAPGWRSAAEDFYALENAVGQAEDFHETQEKLEARKMLYQMFDILGVWPQSSKV